MPSARKSARETGAASGRRASVQTAEDPAAGETKATGRSSASAKTAMSSARSHMSKGSSAFGGTSKRALRMQVSGEDTPGPGAYMPLSTFAKASLGGSDYSRPATAGGSSTTSSRMSITSRVTKTLPTALFRSKSPQRAKVRNENVPGPGAHTPNFTSVSVGGNPSPTNAAPHLQAKGKRFQRGILDDGKVNGTEKVGPGSYETHKYQTLAQDTAHAVSMTSRQNPGFGIGSDQHKLPHEALLSRDDNLPGPGKYSPADVKKRTPPNKGPTAAFRKPMERRKVPDGLFNSPGSSKFSGDSGMSGSESRKSKKKLKQESGRDMVHV